MRVKGLTLIAIFGLLLAVGMVGIADDTQNGYSHTLSITNTPIRRFFPGGLKDIRMINADTADYYIVLNADTNTLKTMMTTTNALCIPGNKTIELNDQSPRITSVSVITLNGEAKAYIGGK
jgi:hypothetical protein